MKTYAIGTKNGFGFGEYRGRDEWSAYEAMCRDAGYRTVSDAVDAGGPAFEDLVIVEESAEVAS